MLYLIIYFNGGKTENELIMKAQSIIKVKEKIWSEVKLQKYKKYWKMLK